MIDRRTALAKADPTVAQLIRREVERQEHGLELIASENFVSVAVMEAMGTALTNKYAEGLPGKRYYGGCEVVDEVEQLAIDRARALFKAEHVNVQPHSGAQANMAAYLAVAKPGDTLLGLALPHGGHLTHGAAVNFSGTLFRAVHYGVREDTGRIEYDQVREVARRERPRVLIGGASAYARVIDFAALRSIADEVDAIFVVDMAHIAGLVAAGIHPSPVPHAQIVTTTTHKTLRGPRGGLILCQEQFAKDVDKQVFPGLQGGPLEHVIAAKAVALGEAMTPEFKAYARQVVQNAQALAAALVERGYAIVSGGTDTHLMLVDLRPKQVTGKEAQELLDRAGITVNKNTIPGEPQKAFVTSGIRIGTPAVTTRGFTETEMHTVATLIDTVLTRKDDATIARVKAEVRGSSGRPSRGSGSLTVHPAEELEVYFNEVAHGRPVGFVASAKWKPPTDIFETDDALVVYMDIAGMRSEDFSVEYVDGILTIAGERQARRNEGKPHYHAMEVQVGPFERRFRLPAPVDPESIRASYEQGFLEVWLAKLPARLSGPQSVRVQ